MSNKRRLNVEEKAVKWGSTATWLEESSLKRNILCPIDPEMYSIKLKSSRLLLNNKEDATKQLLERNCWSADVFLDSIELEIID